MAISVGYLPLMISTFFIVCFSMDSTPVLTATTGNTELATEVCKKTAIFGFCHEVLYSDRRAATANRVTLAYIAFGLAHINTTRAGDFIASWIKSKEGRITDGSLVGMKECQQFYGWAIRSFSEAKGRLDLREYGGLDRLAVKGEGYARNCNASFDGVPTPMSVMNDNLIKFSYICDAVSQLFPEDE